MSTDFSNMGRGKIQTKYFYTFIHNVYASFFKDLLDYLSVHMYPRFEHTVVGTYDKAVEYLVKQEQYEQELDQPMKSALILNPTGEFNIADASAGGKFLWRFPNLAPGLTSRLFDPVYRDDHIKITPGFQRIKGEVELAMLLESFYEYCDCRMLMFTVFGASDRIIEPQFFSSFIILEEDLLNFKYTNEVEGLSYTIDWSGAGATNKLVKTTARNELVLPVNIKPQLTLTSISDASERYGGTDKLPSWRLNATVNYEVELPVWLFLETDYLVENINLEVRYGSAYSHYNDFQPPVNRQIYGYNWDWGLDSTSHSELDLADSTSCLPFVGDFVFKTRYFHVVTQADLDATTYLDISIPEQITRPLILIVNSKYGQLDYGDHYRIVNNGWTLRIIKKYVTLELNMVLELFVYEELVQ
ncbi:MAG: hypothetical protein PVG65_03530 [Candidatus Thorarchaeota archaeon]|jgi:hypothetical protein